MKKYINRLSALVLTAALLLTACGPKAEAASMRLRRTEGRVSVSDGSGKDVEPREDLGLYSGYGVDTRSESYAWIDLDSVKLTKLDEDSEIEIAREGRDLVIEVKSGSLFFNVSEPLADDETMTIRTSAMMVGIRGTCGWVALSEDEEQLSVYLLEGKVRCEADGERETVRAGEMAVMTGDGEITVSPFTARDIPAFVLEELEEDDSLAEAILDDSGLDVKNIPEALRFGSVPMISQGASAAVRADGTLWMWDYGAWGDNNSISYAVRQQYLPNGGTAAVMGLTDVAAVSFSAPRPGGSDVPNFNGAALKTDGSLWMWGDSAWGWESTSSQPIHVMDEVAAVSLGYEYGAVIRTDGSLWVMTTDYYGVGTPTRVMDGVASISAGENTLAAVKTDGTLWMMAPWSSQPVHVMDGAAAVSTSDEVTAAIKTDGSLWLWGNNDYGQIGNGYQGDQMATAAYVDDSSYDPETYSYATGSIQYPIQTTPVKIMDHVTCVSVAFNAVAAVQEDGSLWCWGACGLNPSTNATVDIVYVSDMSYLDHRDVQTVPQKVMDGVAAVSLGHGNLVLKQDGTLWYQSMWGWEDTSMSQILDNIPLPPS